jgi:serine/threonine protein kinase
MEYKKKFIDPESTREKLCPDVEPINKFDAVILCSELAESDLLYYLNNNKLDEREYCRLLKHIFRAIQELHVKHGIVHGDLHLGNILINKKLPIIHDFGKSYRSNFVKHFDRQHDIQYFLGQLLDRDDVPYEVRYKLDPISDIIDNCEGKFPIIDVVKYWDRF